MKKRTARPMTVILLLTAAFLSSGLATAQDHGGRRRGGSLVPHQRVLERLGITEPGQLELINQVKEAAKTDLGILREEQKEYRLQLRTLLDTEDPNPTEVGNLVISARNTGQDIRSIQQSYREQFELLLTLEQLTAWEEFQSNRNNRRGSRRGFRGDGDVSSEGL
ncbi:MAG: hypothetical protein O7G29_09365 [Acidobacteria bacterium]|nr:hypothetical protein [Acidobacteriota bacterium]